MMHFLYCVVLAAVIRFEISYGKSLPRNLNTSEQSDIHINLFYKRSVTSNLDEWLEDSACKRVHLPVASNYTTGPAGMSYAAVCSGIINTVSLTSEEEDILKPFTVGKKLIGRCPYRTKIAFESEAGNSKKYGVVSRECLCQNSPCSKERDASCISIVYGSRAFVLDCLCVKDMDPVVVPTIPIVERKA